MAPVFGAYALLFLVKGLWMWAPLPALGAVWAGAVAVGHWLARPWAPLLGIAGFLVLIGGALYLLSQGAESLFALGLVGFSLWEIIVEYSVWKKLRAGGTDSSTDDNEPPIMLVLLLRESQYLDAQLLSRLVEKAWGVPAEPVADEDEQAETDGDGKVTILGESPQYFLYGQNAFYLVQNFDEPYFDDVAAIAEDVGELRRRQALEQHRAWFGVALLGAMPGRESEHESYRNIARLLAEFADDNTLALVDPRSGGLFPYDPETEEKLRSEDPAEALRQNYFVPVVQVGADDAAMQAAVEEARMRWPEFVTAFENRSDEDETYSVKAPFSDGNYTEFMWVHVTGIENDIIYGTLDNDPVNVRTVKAGGRVRVKVTELNDWFYKCQEKIAGGFTIKVLSEKMKRPPDE